MDIRTKKRFETIGKYTFLTLACLIVAFPIFWVLSSSLKISDDIYQFPQTILPHHPSLESYKVIWTERAFGFAVVNSLIIALSTTLIVMTLGTLAAYGFSRLRFPFDDYIFAGILGVRLLPPIGLLVPFYKTFSTLGLLDHKFALILAYTYLNLPLVVWLMRNYFVSVPKELDEIAKIDGCTQLQAFRKVIIPCVAPGVAASSILAFLFSWNEFLIALTLTTTTQSRTVPVAAALFVGDVHVWWNHISAASFVVIIPAIIFIGLFQKYIVSGLTAGSIKG